MCMRASITSNLLAVAALLLVANPFSYGSTAIDDTQAYPDRILIELSASDELFADTDPTGISSSDLDSFLSARYMDIYRIVRANADELRERIRNVAREPSFEVHVFEETPIVLVAIQAEEYHSGWRSGHAYWFGSVQGHEASRVQLSVFADGTINGVIRSPAFSRIKIEPIKGTPYHVIWRSARGFVGPID